MPNRIIKESICWSEDINNLNDFEETFYYRLIVNSDDFGIFDARPPMLKARLFPLKEISLKKIEKIVLKLHMANMVMLYEYNGLRYGKMVAWEKHQQIRAKRSKYPTPDIKGVNLISIDIKGNQEKSNVPVIQSNPIQSESNLNPNHKLIEKIIIYLNDKAGTKYRTSTTKTREKIEARLNEGFIEDDFYKVIDNKIKDWTDTEYEKYIRPETLFGTKFEGYLNTKIGDKNSKLKTPEKKNKFTDYDQRTYDHDDLEKRAMQKLIEESKGG